MSCWEWARLPYSTRWKNVWLVQTPDLKVTNQVWDSNSVTYSLDVDWNKYMYYPWFSVDSCLPLITSTEPAEYTENQVLVVFPWSLLLNLQNTLKTKCWFLVCSFLLDNFMEKNKAEILSELHGYTCLVFDLILKPYDSSHTLHLHCQYKFEPRLQKTCLRAFATR